MEEWGFLTNHARAMLYIAHDPVVLLRDLAIALDVTERTAFGIVVDLTTAGYVVKEKHGRRNHYQIQAHLPLRDSVPRERTIAEVIDLFLQPAPPLSPQPGTTSATTTRPPDPTTKPTRRRP